VPGLKVFSFDSVIYEDVDVLILSLISASVLREASQPVSFISQVIEKIIHPGYLSNPSGSQTSGLSTEVEMAQHFLVRCIH